MQRPKRSSSLPIGFIERKKETYTCFVSFFLFFICFASFPISFVVNAAENKTTDTPTFDQAKNTEQGNLQTNIEENKDFTTQISLIDEKNSQELGKSNFNESLHDSEIHSEKKQEFTTINNTDNAKNTHTTNTIDTKDTKNNSTERPPATDFSQNANFGWQKYFQAIGTMLFLLLALWYILKLVKRYGQGKFLPNQKLLPKNSMYLEGQLSLGPNKCVTIVNILNKRLVLGVTEKNITLLTEIYENTETEEQKRETNFVSNSNIQNKLLPNTQTLQNTNNKETQNHIHPFQTFHEHLYAQTHVETEKASLSSFQNNAQNFNQRGIQHDISKQDQIPTKDEKQCQAHVHANLTKKANNNTSNSTTYSTAGNTIENLTKNKLSNTVKPLTKHKENNLAKNTTEKATFHENSYEKRASRLLNAFKRSGKLISLFLFSFLVFPSLAFADIPTFSMTLSGGEAEPSSVSLSLEILFLFTILSLAPAIAMTVTSFTRIIIVFHFIRQAMGIQQIPPTQILASLAIFMSIVIMYPVGQEIHDNALQPYLQERISFDDALERAQIPIRNFMFKHTREKDMSLFYSIAQMEAPQNKDEVPTIMLAAAFVISEFKTAFSIGFLIYIPFLIVDMVVSSILLAMGMMMLPPMMVSMPFKLLLFVVVDGWNLLIGSLVNSFLAI